jgi:hypothetical protein
MTVVSLDDAGTVVGAGAHIVSAAGTNGVIDGATRIDDPPCRPDATLSAALSASRSKWSPGVLTDSVVADFD